MDYRDPDMNDKAPAMKGSIEYFHVDGEGSLHSLGSQPNMVTLQGADLQALALAGDRKVDGMYMVYDNGGALRVLATEDNNAATYAVEGTDHGLCRVALAAHPTFTTNDVESYAGNEANFLAVSGGGLVFPGVPLTDGVSEFYHVALVSLGTTQEDDLVLSCVSLSSDVPKAVGLQFGVRWKIRCN